MTEATYHWDAISVPTSGKDHLTLSDWRMSIPSKHSILAEESGGREEKRGVVEYQFPRPDGSLQRVTLESGAVTAFPVTNDDAVLIALITLSDMAGHPEVLRFEPSHVLSLLRRPDNPFNIAKVKRAIERFQRLSSSFEGVWFSRKEKKVLPTYDTGIIAEAACVSQRGRRKKGERLSHVQWTKSFHESLEEGNLLSIDLELLASWDRPGTMQLYRHLNKVWHGGRKPSLYERDLEELACGHLLMSRTKDTKRNFAAIVAEMESKQFIAPLSPSERFTKSQGRWRVRIEPQKVPNKSPESTATNIAAGAEDQLLAAAYLRHRFAGDAVRSPALKELACARRLLAKAPLTRLLDLTPAVAASVQSRKANDLYFSFAERFYEDALAADTQAKREGNKRRDIATVASARSDDVATELQAKQARRNRLLAEWRRSTPVQQARCVERALGRDTARSYRDRILDSSIEEPAPEVLTELESFLLAPQAA